MQPRKKMRRQGGAFDCRFLTFSCEGRRPHFGSARLRDLFAHQLAHSSARARVVVHAWVVMPNHVHLLVTPKDNGLERWLGALKGRVARLAMQVPGFDPIASGGDDGVFWLAGGGFDRRIYSEPRFDQKQSYIHGNPVVRGLCEDPCDWTWSSARDWRMGQRAGYPTIADFGLCVPPRSGITLPPCTAT